MLMQYADKYIQMKNILWFCDLWEKSTKTFFHYRNQKNASTSPYFMLLKTITSLILDWENNCLIYANEANKAIQKK